MSEKTSNFFQGTNLTNKCRLDKHWPLCFFWSSPSHRHTTSSVVLPAWKLTHCQSKFAFNYTQCCAGSAGDFESSYTDFRSWESCYINPLLTEFFHIRNLYSIYVIFTRILRNSASPVQCGLMVTERRYHMFSNWHTIIYLSVYSTML
jgi:hypothetical protein